MHIERKGKLFNGAEGEFVAGRMLLESIHRVCDNGQANPSSDETTRAKHVELLTSIPRTRVYVTLGIPGDVKTERTLELALDRHLEGILR